MEIINVAERRLLENLNKCRCCFRMLIDDRGSVKIDAEVRNQFLELTQIELLESEIFADRMCKLCARDLSVFSNLRKDLAAKQRELYDLANIDEADFIKSENAKHDEPDFIQECSSDYEGKFEAIEQDDYTTVYVEEPIDDGGGESGEEQEDMAATEAILQIEKIHAKSEGENGDEDEDKCEMEEDEDGCSTSYALFTEIVGGDSEDMQFSESSDYTKNEMISCDLCGIEVAKNHLIEHRRVMHKTFFCAHCNKKFQSKISLKRHEAESHVGEKISRSKTRHFCPLCPKDYDYKKQLEDHIRSFHDKERNSQCQICDKLFYHRDLKKHIEHVHGDKTIKCEICGKLYTCVENLRLHMRYHQPPAFTCSYPSCGKKFHQKVLWEHHEKKHTDFKPEVCEHCNSAFYSVRDLKRHFQRVHEKVTRKCFLCDMQFSRKDKYRLHLMKKHTEISRDERENLLEQVKAMKWNES